MSCNHNCNNCSGDCNKKPSYFSLSEGSTINKIIGVVSGKGGVGKSTVTSLLATSLAKQGYKVGILDADITGPSIPKAFGVTKEVSGNETVMFPPITDKYGIKVMSINLLIDDPTKPVLWRGPVIAGAVKQFYSDVLWEDLDYLLIDMPPGTSDVALTIFQSIPLSGVVIVSTPQDLVSMIVGKACNMAKEMNVNILGLVENMSFISCPCCNNKIYPFGKSKVNEVASMYNIKALGSLPIDTKINELMDSGNIVDADTRFIDDIAKNL